MAIPVLQTPMPTFAQANPWAQGAQTVQNIQHQAIQNRFLAPMMQARLKQMGLQAQQMPIQTQLMQSRLAQMPIQAKLMQEKADLYPQLTKEQINRAKDLSKQELFKRLHPLLGLSGPAGNIGALEYLQNQLKLKTGGQAGGQTGGVSAGAGTGLSPTNDPLNYQQARTNSDLQNMGVMPSSLPQVGANITQRSGSPGQAGSGNQLIDDLQKGIFSKQKLQDARSNYYTKMVQSTNWRSLPVDQKTALLAQAAGMGYDNISAAQLFMNGNTVADLAKAKGYDPKNPPAPNYALTKSDIGRLHQTQAANSEIQKLNPKIYSALAPYSQRFMGYSPKQISEAMSNENPDAQAKFFAAKALVPEMMMIRSRLANPGTRAGVELVKEMTNASMSHIKAYQALVSPQVYTQANKYIDQWLQGAIKARLKPILTAGKAGQQTTYQGGAASNNASTGNDPLGIR